MRFEHGLGGGDVPARSTCSDPLGPLPVAPSLPSLGPGSGPDPVLGASPPAPAEPSVRRAGGGPAAAAPGGLPPQPGGPVPVPHPGRPGAARLPGAGGVRGHLQVRGQAGQVRAFWSGTPVSQTPRPQPAHPSFSAGTSSSRWSPWGFFATTGWAAGWAP